MHTFFLSSYSQITFVPTQLHAPSLWLKKNQENENQTNNKTIGINLFYGAHFKAESIQAVTWLLFTEFIPVYSPKDQKFGEKSENINPKIGSAPFTDLDS